jgi:hypothetical protein
MFTDSLLYFTLASYIPFKQHLIACAGIADILFPSSDQSAVHNRNAAEQDTENWRFLWRSVERLGEAS